MRGNIKMCRDTVSRHIFSFDIKDPVFLAGERRSLLCVRIAENAMADALIVPLYAMKLQEGFSEHPKWKELLENADILVDGPFILAKKSLMLRFRGSSNQRILDVQKSLTENRPVIIEELNNN